MIGRESMAVTVRHLRITARRHAEPEEALQAFVAEAVPRILGYILARVDGDRDLAEDLTQETMIALVRALQSDETAVADRMGWLFGVARHKVIDHYRSRGALTADSGELETLIDPTPDIDRVLDRADLATYLVHIPIQQRLVLILHYGDGLSIGEIGGLIEKSPHAVESLLARARRSMRHVVAAEREQ